MFGGTMDKTLIRYLKFEDIIFYNHFLEKHIK